MLRSNQLVRAFAAIFLLTAHTPVFTQNDLDSTDIQIFSNPKSGYVVRGEQFDTEISILVDNKVPDEGKAFIRVNDKQLIPENGRARYRQYANDVGQNTYTVTVSVYIGSENITRTQDFNFEVGHRCIAASAAKMYVLYVGVDNPVSVYVAGFPSTDVQVSATGGTISKPNQYTYTLQVDQPGEATLHVQAGSLKSDFPFRVKAIPDPVPFFGGLSLPEEMEAEKFREQGGVGLSLQNFDFDARCNMQQYEVVRISADGERESVVNSGARFGEAARTLREKAVSGDIFLFRSIECECPGDKTPRKIRGFSVEIQ